MKEFTCEYCLRTFKKGKSDAEAMKEYASAPWNVPNDDIGVLCEYCFQEFKQWFSSLSEEQRRKIRGQIK
jgi:hypothetical protein